MDIDKKTIVERIKSIIDDALKLKRKDGAKCMGISESYLSRIIKGVILPNTTQIYLLKNKYPQINTDFIFSGIGNPLNDYTQVMNESFLLKESELVKRENEILKQRLSLMEERNIFETEVISDSNIISNPVSINRKKSESTK